MYYDPMYPGMRPMTCLGPTATAADGTNDEWNCLLRIGNTYGAPFVQQSGTSRTHPGRCDCTNPAHVLSDACDQIDLLVGLVVYDLSANASVASKHPAVFQPFLPFMEFFYVAPVQTAKSISKNSYNPAFAGVYSWAADQSTDPKAKQMLDPVWRSAVYEYTNVPSFQYGKVITFHVYSSAGDDDRSVSANNYQLTDGACADSMTSPSFSNLIDTPMSPLVEDYYQCTMGYWDSFVNAMGIATTNANNFASLFALPVCFTVWFLGLSLQKGRRIVGVALDGSVHDHDTVGRGSGVN
jgi:hypothetical protein